MRVMLRCLLALLLASSIARAAERPPNILFILADDLGYGDLGVTYQNSREGKPAFSTPHLDDLAKSGLMLRNHYCAAPVCAPSRASLMTGQSQGHCAIRDNQFDKALPDNVLTVADVLKQAKYHTIAIGKWGLAGNAKSGYPAHPMRRGFDDFFGFMEHRTGHVYYHDAEHPLMDGLTDIGAKYENVYSTDLFTARAKKFIVDHEKERPDQPFFMYLAYTAIHNALNVPGGPYPAGAGKSGGLQWPLTPTPETRNTWIHPDYANKQWTKPMKHYATMARRLDDGVHDVLGLLQDLNIADNTLIVFTSDNGPANEGGADPRLFDSWGPFDGFKRDVFEGGVREPTIVAWPAKIKAGATSDIVSAQYDWMPTLAEVAHLPIPAQTDGVSLVPTLLGSQQERPYIYVEYNFADNGKQGAAGDVRSRKGEIRRQQQVVRMGDFVGVRTQIQDPTQRLRLYSVSSDPHQDHDLASDPSQETLLRRMTNLLVTARMPNESAPRPYDDVDLPAVAVNELEHGHVERWVYLGSWPWVPEFGGVTAKFMDKAEAIGLPKEVPPGPFGLQFKGYLVVPESGEYTFTAGSDGGFHLWLHDAHVIDADRASAGKTGKVRLAKGVHPLRVAYAHRAGDAKLELRYSGPGVQEQVIPAAALLGEK